MNRYRKTMTRFDGKMKRACLKILWTALYLECHLLFYAILSMPLPALDLAGQIGKHEVKFFSKYL